MIIVVIIVLYITNSNIHLQLHLDKSLDFRMMVVILSNINYCLLKIIELVELLRILSTVHV